MNNIAILIGGTNGNNQWWMGDLKVVNQLRRRCNFGIFVFVELNFCFLLYPSGCHLNISDNIEIC